MCHICLQNAAQDWDNYAATQSGLQPLNAPLPVWNTSQIIDQLQTPFRINGNVIEYAFPTDASYWIGLESAGHSPLNSLQQAQARLAYSLWDDLIAPSLEETSNAQTADLTISNTTTGIVYAHAWLPIDGFVSGAAWLNTNNYGLQNPLVGQYAFTTFLHEIGHTLGLEHAGDYGTGPLPAFEDGASHTEDSRMYTVMSYYSATLTGADWNGYNPQTPMVNDILAIQAVYGADMTTRAADTVYGFNSNTNSPIFDFAQNRNPVLTIWDGGGNDTLDLTGFGPGLNSLGSVVNLTPGSFSSTAFMTSNIAIAYGAWIENAIGGYWNDRITGNDLANKLYGNSGDDELNGGLGNDRLYGGDGDDSLMGGGGKDHLYSGAGGDRLDGGADLDWARYDLSPTAVTVNLATGQSAGGFAEGDTLISIERVHGSAYSDTLYGDGGSNWLVGLGGNDHLYGQGGEDILDGRGGNDRLYAGSGANTLLGAHGTDHLFSGAGSDILDGGSGNDWARYDLSNAGVNVDLGTGSASGGYAQGDSLNAIERVHGSGHADQITGDHGDNWLIGLGGSDILRGQGGDDRLEGRAGNDRLFAGPGTDRLEGGSGRDHLFSGEGADSLNGGAHDDWARYDYSNAGVHVNLMNGTASGGFAQGDTLTAVEWVHGSSHNDVLHGDGGQNWLIGLAGNDQLRGGAGDDRLDGRSGNDLLDGGSGADRLWGGAGSDSFVFQSGSGHDQIYDLSAEDLIMIDHAVSSSYASLMHMARQVSDNVVISFDAANSLTLHGTAIADLGVDDFEFI